MERTRQASSRPSNRNPWHNVDRTTIPIPISATRNVARRNFSGRVVTNRIQKSDHGKLKFKRPSLKIIWLLLCLTGLGIHSSFVIETYLLYEVATETVIETPKSVVPPATSVCFLLWHLLKNETFERGHNCRKTLKKGDAIQKCVQTLVEKPLKDILNITRSPLDYFEFFEVREPNNKWTTYESNVTFKEAIEQKNLYEYYNGPYRCIRLETGRRDKRGKKDHLSVSFLTKGYPKSRFFANASFNVSPNITPEILTVRAYVHESHTFPRGAVTLPVILNVTREQLFIISYRRVETYFLPAPFKFGCIDYSGIGNLESREHCIDECLAKNETTLPFTAVITDLDKDYNLTTKEDRPQEDYCGNKCTVDCLTITFYTMLADSSSEEETLTVITRFQEPETTVRYIPKLDLQAFIIYEAGILSTWFSASIFFTLQDFYVTIRKAIRVLLQ